MDLASHYEYDQRIADVWGWFNPVDEKEYAIVGVHDGVSIVEVTNPRDVSDCLLYTSPSPRDRQKSRMPSSA